ncbi:hypothetical protein BGZ96_010432 [Linnemannia gamsii]|uniref:Uncharacterized protein n=1 Tax=Linnemannia gamsii TaxID=64522 RepID=A0ABQ7JW54_9FUNG|nr:hypothetical protein BGZ96_010432 [Linnemannia gamsii]
MTSTVKSILSGIAMAYAALYLTRAIQFVLEFNHDMGISRGDIASLNTHGCAPVTFTAKQGEMGKEKEVWLEGCEDVHVHQKSGLAFTACVKNVESRKVWYPPASKLSKEDTRLNGWLKDRLVVYDIENGFAQEMELVGFPADVDRVFHGLDFYENLTTPVSSTTENSSDDDKNKELALTLFVVNHRRTGSVVEVFEYTRTTNKSLGVVRYAETVVSELIRTPNDVLAMGRRSFYVTNDHFYKQGYMRNIEGT